MVVSRLLSLFSVALACHLLGGVQVEGWGCKSRMNLVVVVEAPEPAPYAAQPSINVHVTNLMRTLEAEYIGCITYKLLIAKNAVVEVPRQFLGGGWLKNVLLDRSITQISSKLTFAKILDGFYEESHFFSKKKADNEKRAVILIVTSGPVKKEVAAANDLYLYDSAKSLAEGPPDELVPVIAIGVGEGQRENLKRLSFFEPHNIRALNFDEIYNKGAWHYQALRSLLDDPNAPPPPNPSMLVYASPLALKQEKIAEVVPISQRCTRPVLDIGFIIDSSGSIRLDYKDELFFVQKIAARFGISKDGHHAGAVVFSDKGYIDLHIKLDEIFDTEEFNAKIRKSRMFGYRTRIDLAFKTVEEQLFVPSGGVRADKKKVIFLVTDGKQNPPKDVNTGELFDPVAASQGMIDDGVEIFAVGIGRRIVKEQLNAITRSDGSKVFYAKTIENLINQEFVDELTKEVCVQIQPPKPKTTAAPQSGHLKTACVATAGPVGPLGGGKCCGNVYINIFQSGAGPAYVLQGMQVTQSGNDKASLTGEYIPGMKSVNGKDYSTAEIIKIVEKALPNDKVLSASLKEYLCGDKCSTSNNKRKRRSIEEVDLVREMLSVASSRGDCAKFVALLKQSGLIEKIEHHATVLNRNITLFCPVNGALENIPTRAQDLPALLQRHISFANDGYIYDMMDGNHVHMAPKKSGWTVENAEVVNSFKGKLSVVTLDRVIEHQQSTLMQALRRNKKTKIMYEMMKQLKGSDSLRSNQINKICFQSNLCVNLVGELKDRIMNVVRTNKITFVAPSDNVLKHHMKKKELKKLLTHEDDLKKFISSRAFLGIVPEKIDAHNSSMILQPTVDSQPISVLDRDTAGHVTRHSPHDTRSFKVVQTTRVKEGVLLVEDLE